MPKVTDRFKEVIENKLNEMADSDPLLAKTLTKEDKDIDGCINYILQEVKATGAIGFPNEEIYALAVHYYDEDDLEENDPIKCNVVLPYRPELTDEEKQELKEEARQDVFNKEKRRLYSSRSKPSRNKKDKPQQSNLF